jgi:hypothetical protein
MQNRIAAHVRSNLIGYVALFIALSGTAYAVDGPLPGQDQVGSADIINNDVQSADLKDANVASVDIRSSAITTGKILDNDVRSADVLDNSLTGADVSEATLGKVPDADTLDGVDSSGFVRGSGSIQKLDFRANDGTGLTQVLDLGGLQLLATCDSSFGQGPKDLRIFWTSTVDNASLGVSYSQFGDGVAHTDYDSHMATGGTISEGNLSTADDDRTVGTMVYTRPEGGNVSVAFQAEDSNGSAGSDPLGGTKDCIFTGTATHAP